MIGPDGPEEREAERQEWIEDMAEEYEIESELGDEARDDPMNWER